ncbi:MAG: ABC transporter substrate-binding protein [Chloroflexota bacterium]
MQKKRGFSLLLMMVALLFAFSAVSAQDEAKFAGGWPYPVAPTGHYNQFAVNNLNLGIYWDVMQPPMAEYIWSADTYEGLLADSFGFDEDNNYVVTLKSGLTWSDGSPVTSQDVVTTFNILYLNKAQVWSSISGVEAVDDLTAKFTVVTPSKEVERQILTENIGATSVYGDIAARAGEFAAAKVTTGDAGFDALLSELTDFRPEGPVASGPYVIDPASITDANLNLVKNEGGLNSDIVRFDVLQIWNGETEAVTPLVANGDLYYGTYGFPPATEASFIDQGIDIIRGPSRNGPGIYVNHSVYPLDKVEVRQAIAYVVNREQNGFVALGESGIANDCMCGMSDLLAEVWLSEDTLDSLNHYDQDADAATALLEGIGFTKGNDGKWLDDQGNPLAFELLFPSDFTDWSAAAENATQQLNDFGFTITARGAQSAQQQQDVYDGNFQMAIRNWGIGSPFPGRSYLEAYNRYNGQGELAGEGVGGGMHFNLDMTYSGGEINGFDMATQAGQGLDVDAQKEIVTALALSYNELLPAIPLWERYGNNPLNREFLDAPASDDPIYQNAGTDAFMPYLILTGKIGPAA